MDFELIFLSEDTSLIAKGEYENGIKYGLWSYSNADSTFIQGGKYTEKGYKTGFWQIFIGGVERARMLYKNDTLDGKYILFHPNRTAAVTTFFSDGQLEGVWTSYRQNGQQYETGGFKEGKKTGEWKVYHPLMSRVEIRSNYVDGLLDGEFRQYDLAGDLTLKTSYTRGQLDGEWTKYDMGVVIEEGFFKEGKRDSTWSYFEFGSFPSIREYYDEGERTGTWSTYHPNRRKASEITYKDDKPVGASRTWHSNKQLASETRYRLGLEDSIYTEYFRGGELAATGRYELGLRKGPWKFYHENGLLAELGQYENNKKSGNWKTFNSSGRLIAEGNYKFGQETGQWFNYYDNGQLESIGSFTVGEKDGLWGYFHQDGKPMFEERWNDGKLIFVSKFTSDRGKILNTGSLSNGTGERINYRPDGTLFSQGPYKNGLPDGFWTFYDEKERKLMYGMIKAGVKEGQWMIYARNGSVIRVETFLNGELIDSDFR
jgi:antitoxin component YwqK of YwqJK toxin-antitoxin module